MTGRRCPPRPKQPRPVQVAKIGEAQPLSLHIDDVSPRSVRCECALSRTFIPIATQAFKAPARQFPRHGAGHRVVLCKRRQSREVLCISDGPPPVVVHAKRRKTNAPMPEHRIQVSRVIRTGADLRHEQRIVGPVVQLRHLERPGAVGQIDVRSQQVNGRRGRLPDRDHIVGGAAALIRRRSRRIERIAQRRVDVQRQRIDRLASRRNVPDVPGDRPRVEILVGVVAENLLPGPLLTDGLVERLEHLGLEQLRRHRPVKFLLGGRGEVPHAPPRSGLVLHLDH